MAARCRRGRRSGRAGQRAVRRDLSVSERPTAASGPQARPADAQQCPDPYPATRDPSNPLALPVAPGANPLNGANFFVDGPRHGEAAGAIAQLLGIDPTRYHDDYSWARFKASLAHGGLHRKLKHNRALARKVALLEKIADQPEAQRFSLLLGRRGARRDLRPGAEDLLPQHDRRSRLDPDHHHLLPLPGGLLRDEQRDHRPPSDVRAPGERDGGGDRAPAGRDAARARCDRIVELHGPQRCPGRVGERHALRDRPGLDPPPRRGLHRGRLLGRRIPRPTRLAS